jgi:hypothetical protein
MPIPLNDLVNAILDIEDPDDLDRLSETIKTRDRQLADARATRIAAELRLGDRVRITDGISPKYLLGVTGVVDRPASRKEVAIRPDHPELIPGRLERILYPDGTMHVSPSVLEIIERAESTGSEQ